MGEQRFNDEDELLVDDLTVSEYSEMVDRIAELEERERWIPVSERLPEDGQLVEFYEPHCRYTSEQGIGIDVFNQQNSDWSSTNAKGQPWITHWKPITPPEKGE